MAEYTEISPGALQGNPFELIGKEWMLITAGNADKMNTMTASWGGLGVLWNKPVAFAFVRPTRYTYDFLEQEDHFTLSFYGEEYREALTLCGRVSGRDGNKIAKAGLTPCSDEAAPYFSEARLVLFCRKIAAQDLDPKGFIDPAIAGHYDNDYHRVYVGEIVKVYQQKG